VISPGAISRTIPIMPGFLRTRRLQCDRGKQSAVQNAC
jgi:hypothetical protein